MKISVVTLFPELYSSFLGTSLIKRAQEQGALSCETISLFDVCAPKERADGPIFGHGPGLLLRPDVIERAIEQQEKRYGKAFRIFFSPQGTQLDQAVLRTLYSKIQECGGHCMVLPARYEGMDVRVEEEYADIVISIGDFVLMGGDLPAMVLLEGLVRFVPGVVGKGESVEKDSFSGAFVDHPHYTAPVVWHGKEVPEVIRSGNHAAQDQWRREKAAETTVKHHFEWLRSHVETKEDIALAARFIPPHYAALMHTNVLVQQNVEGNSSIMSIDIHDIARAARTYGFKRTFVATPLEDQQKIATRLIDFWQTGEGVTYNPSRHEAVSEVSLVANLDEIIEAITSKEGASPILIGTSARRVDSVENITYYDQETVWKSGRPVLFIFGTANGLAPSILQRCDFIIGPVCGFSRFNHLSVRSAAAIVFDRWLGIKTKL
ncbi:TPA: tRNA (guanosine(37)-N1)-methyltransferase TrmD [Candidatus Dependentiae bacterium]|nr:MAG: tRNA (guanine-N(1)-)-methyltransferase [candidate division TM6 bacterium GW2011_GWF2_43_87]HBL98486.1 tRNA (guanosine(37)-N1)-methyltransferase TrmD [Candidatus Dependentiae bacterium]